MSTSSLPVFGCDLYLLEHWDESVSLSDDEQMTQIFARYGELSTAQRLVYSKRAWKIDSAKSLPQADQDLLHRVRPDDERISHDNSEAIWLRTYYGPGSNEIFMREFDEDLTGKDSVVFNDATRYSFGDDWQRIFHRMPQLLDVDHRYDARVVRTLARTKHEERQQRALAELKGCEPPYGILSHSDLYAYWHIVRHVGFMCVLDDQALGGGVDSDGRLTSPDGLQRVLCGWFDDGWFDQEGKLAREIRYRIDADGRPRKVLCGWFSPQGKWLRATRMGPVDAVDFEGMLMDCSFSDSPEWLEADFIDTLPDPEDFESNPVTEADLESLGPDHSDYEDGRYDDDE